MVVWRLWGAGAEPRGVASDPCLVRFECNNVTILWPQDACIRCNTPLQIGLADPSCMTIFMEDYMKQLEYVLQAAMYHPVSELQLCSTQRNPGVMAIVSNRKKAVNWYWFELYSSPGCFSSSASWPLQNLRWLTVYEANETTLAQK